MRLVRVAFGVALQLLCVASVLSDGNNAISSKIKLRLYGEKQRYEYKSYLERPLNLATQLFSESKGYNSSLPLVLLVHGMAMSADSHFTNGVVQALMKKKIHKTHNIIAVDMPELMENDLDSKLYFGVLSNVKPSGEILGEFLNFLISLKIITPGQINIIGYSMGTQVAGYIGREVRASFGKIHYIAGMEPVGPGFHSRLGGKLPSLVHVSKEDAKVTHFFHTNSHGFGSHTRDGSADFVFNNGDMQPGCGHYASLNCSHARAPYLYEEALVTPKQFVARSCDTWHHFDNCQCEQHKNVLIDFPPDTRARGIYFLRTSAASPYGLGEKGSHCSLPEREHWNGNMVDHNPAESSTLTEPKYPFLKGLNLYRKKAFQSVNYFYKVLKGKKKNVDADNSEGEVEPDTDETGTAEASGAKAVEPKEHLESVKYEIEFISHKNEPQGTPQKYAFSEDEPQHTTAPKPKNAKVSLLDVNQDKAANKITEDEEANGDEPNPFKQGNFEAFLQNDQLMETENNESDDIIVFEDSQSLDGEDHGPKANPHPTVKMGLKEASLQTENDKENKAKIKNDKDSK